MTLTLAIDQGTTGTTCLVVDDEPAVRGRGYAELLLQTGVIKQIPDLGKLADTKFVQ